MSRVNKLNDFPENEINKFHAEFSVFTEFGNARKDAC